MAMPVIKGEKTAGERFPGAVATYSIEAMMQDRKALQAGTSHFLGQNFAKAQEIKFQSEAGELEYAWTTSWGVSTRLIGGLIMTHSDDDGLVLPPKLAPAHVVILPLYRNDEERAAVLPYCESLKAELTAQSYDSEPVRVRIDNRDLRGGDKKWQWIKKGVPLIAEVGPRDIADGKVMLKRRDLEGKGEAVPRVDLVYSVATRLEAIQQNLFERAVKLRTESTINIDSLDKFEEYFAESAQGGLAYCHFVDSEVMEAKLKELKCTVRCIPLDAPVEAGKCIFTGAPSNKRGVFAKSY